MLNMFLRSPLLWNQMVLKVRIVYHRYTSPPPPPLFFFFIFPPFLPYFSLAFSFYGKAPGIFPSFNNFAKVSSHFLQHTVQSFTKSSEKSEGQEEEALPQGADTGFFNSLLLSQLYMFSFLLSPSDFVCFCRCGYKC